MSNTLTPGRELLLEILDVPEVFAKLPDDADLILAGINSGDLIRLGLTIEERTQLPLSDDELCSLQTITGIDRILAERARH